MSENAVGKGVGAQKAGRNNAAAKEVDDLHANSDLDSRPEAQHHTLGPNQNQASPGNHRHDGGSSPFLWSGTTITGARGGNMAVASIISALVQKGCVDATTA